jgi:hypothetical protein
MLEQGHSWRENRMAVGIQEMPGNPWPDHYMGAERSIRLG